LRTWLAKSQNIAQNNQSKQFLDDVGFGFNDPKYFSRTFSGDCGVSPIELNK